MGRGECDIEKGPLIGHIGIPRQHKFDEADTESGEAFLDVLAEGSQNDSYAARFMPIYTYAEITPTGDEAQTETLANGQIRRLRDGKIGYDFLVVEGMNVFRNFKASIDGRQGQYDVLEVTNQGDGTYGIWGTKAKDEDSNTVLAGYRLERLDVSKYTPSVYTAGARFTVSTGYADNNQVDKNWAVIIVDSNPFDVMTGLMSVDITATSPTALTIAVRATTTWGVDLNTDNSAALAQVGLWKVVNRKVGSADYGDVITVASVAPTSTGVTLTLAAVGVDSDNPGAGQKVGVSFVAPSVAGALTTPLIGYESDEVIVTLGA